MILKLTRVTQLFETYNIVPQERSLKTSVSSTVLGPGHKPCSQILTVEKDAHRNVYRKLSYIQHTHVMDYRHNNKVYLTRGLGGEKVTKEWARRSRRLEEGFCEALAEGGRKDTK